MVFVDVGAWSQGMGLRGWCKGGGIEVAGAGIMDRVTRERKEGRTWGRCVS